MKRGKLTLWVAVLAPPRKPVNYKETKFNVKKPAACDLEMFVDTTEPGTEAAVEAEKVQQAWLEGVVCDGFVRCFTEASEGSVEMKRTLVSAMCMFLEVAVPIIENPMVASGVKCAVMTFRGLLCIMSSVPRIHGAIFESFQYVAVPDIQRAAIIKHLPRGVGRIITTSVRSKWTQEADRYQQAAGAEAVVGGDVWSTECDLLSLKSQTVNEMYVGTVKGKLQHVSFMLASWQKSLRPNACSGLEAACVDVIRRIVTSDVMDRSQPRESHELYGLFDKIVKMPVDPEVIDCAKEVHSMVLGKLELVQGAALHTQLMALVAEINTVTGPRQLQDILSSLTAGLTSKPGLPADILQHLKAVPSDMISRLCRGDLEAFDWSPEGTSA